MKIRFTLLMSTLLLVTQTNATTTEMNNRVVLEQLEQSEQYENRITSMGPTVEQPPHLDYRLTDVIYRASFFKFETVIKNLHSVVENETDIIYFVNTSMQKNYCHKLSLFSLPPQHLTIIRRINPNLPLLKRDSQNNVVDFNFDNIQLAELKKNELNKIDFSKSPVFNRLSNLNSTSTTYIPVSTGTRAGSSILTFSGIFRINEIRTNAKRKSSNTTNDPMQNSVYINTEYNDGTESGVALHGTPSRFWNQLGENQSSHGCVRLQTNFSLWNQSLLFDKKQTGELIPRAELLGDVHLWNRRDLYPPNENNFKSLPTGKKLKVLVILFDGYQSDCT